MLHRLWFCPACEEERIDTVGEKLLSRIRDELSADPDPGFKLVCESGLIPHPALWAPGPLTQSDALDHVVFQVFPEAFQAEGLPVPSEGVWEFQGDIYTDGSCLRPSIKDLSRSGWGVVCLGPSGQILARMYGALGNFYPQTSVAAEFAAPASASSLLAGPSVFFSDCAAVVNEFSKSRDDNLSPNRPYSGLVMQSYAFQVNLSARCRRSRRIRLTTLTSLRLSVGISSVITLPTRRRKQELDCTLIWRRLIVRI